MPPKTSNSRPPTSHANEPPKMRSSCKACADSKIGCTKERPTCSRCERRDVPCVYMATKRAGRRAKNKRPQSPPTQADTGGNPATFSHSISSGASCASPSSRSSWAGWPSYMTDTPNIFTPPPSAVPQQTADWCFPVDSALFESMPVSAVDENDFVSSLPSFTQPLSELLGVSLPPSLLDHDMDRTLNLDSFSLQSVIGNEANGVRHHEKATSSTQSACRNDHSGGDPNDEPAVPSANRRTAGTPTESIDWFAASDVPNSSGFTPILDGSVSKDRTLPKPPSSHDRHSSRGCLARCLCLLGQLAPQWTAAPCTQDKEKSPTPISASFESVIAQNQAVIDAVDDILKCPCSRNSVLLFALALVVFKMLGWYAACANTAKRTPSGQDPDGSEAVMPASSLEKIPLMVRRPSQSTMLDYEMDIDYEDRIVCQIVLSRLYSVRSTLNILTQRLTVTKDKEDISTSSSNQVSAAIETLLLDGPAFNLSSSSNLGQSLASNLRCHLHELCDSIIKTLSAT
jgi:hypothetical protein